MIVELKLRKTGGKTYIIKELGTCVALNIVGVEVSPTQLHINPEFVAGRTIKHVLDLEDISQLKLGTYKVDSYISDERWS